jgi:phage shock protein PspC (stress-responsive transcriptional regulator)
MTFSDGIGLFFLGMVVTVIVLYLILFKFMDTTDKENDNRTD